MSDDGSKENSTTSTSAVCYDGLLPRRETQALDFLKKYPQYDGSNVLIGILDTGIDPGAAGIRYMEDGVTPKLMDMVDCTGSGDVDIRTEREVVELDGGYYQVMGLSGRNLKLKRSWWKSIVASSSLQGKDGKDDAPKKKEGRKFPPSLPTVKLGIKPAFELFPSSLVNRVKAHRKRQFDQECNVYVANVQRELANWQEIFGGNKKTTPADIRTREDLQAKLDVLMGKDWETEDPGMILDCVVFHDGERYRAVLYGGNEDDLENEVDKVHPLAAFSEERQYGTISTVDQYNYGINFYDDATVLSIVGDCTPHGTHVAAIAAGAEGDGRSGVAPGAQLVSIKIGDSRLGSMETTSALIRGILAAIRLQCDVINLSYGEGCQVPNSGRVIQLAEELVWRYNVTFVSAVGNNGPALSTVNAPGGTSSCILGVAAYVSPEMMRTEYSMTSNTAATGDASDENRFVGTTYTWSSVGPTVDGSNGVCICAPGGAITSVSNWTMQKSMLMNGTSMASPHACGCVALLLSACKAEGIPTSPSLVQRALQNTAMPMQELSQHQQGWGMIQVEKAFQYLQMATNCRGLQDENVHFEVYVDNRSGNPRGIYLRQPEESSICQTFSVRVNPRFPRKDKPDDTDQRLRIGFEMQFDISTTSSWVSVPDKFMLMNNGRSFKIEVDPTALTHGVHIAKVVGHVAGHASLGPYWSLPITVVKPLEADQLIEQRNIELKPTEVVRFFVSPPPGSTWMDITIRDSRKRSDDSNASSRLFVLHTVQLLPHSAYRDHAHQKYLNLLPNQTSVASVPIEPRITCEVALARYWSANGNVKAELKIEFRGVQPIPSVLTLLSGDTFGFVRLESLLVDEYVHPSAKFTKCRTPVRPKAGGIIKPLGERDIFPWNDNKIYQLHLIYEFLQDDKGPLTPLAPALQGILYESTYESQLMMIFDGEKRYLGCVDAYPSSVIVGKGSVFIHMQIRHDDQKMLEKLKDMPIWIERKLEKEISMSVYSTRDDLLGGKRAMKKRMLRKGCHASLFLSEPAASKLPSSCKPGDVLVGSIFYCSAESSLPGDGKRPNGFTVMCTVGPKLDTPSDPETIVEPRDERTAEERINAAVRDFKVEQLGKLTSAEKEKGDFEKLFDDLQKEYPGYVPLLMARLKYLDGLKAREENLLSVVTAADQIITEINGDDLALHFGRKTDKEDPQQVKKNKEMEKQKGFLIEALARQAFAYSDLQLEGAKDNFEKTLTLLKAWVDIDSNGRFAGLALERDCRANRYGLALKKVNKLLSKTNGKDTGGVRPLTRSDLIEKRVKIFELLGYESLVKREKSIKLVASPVDYRLF